MVKSTVPFATDRGFWALSPSDGKISVLEKSFFNPSSRIQPSLPSATAQRSNVNKPIFFDPTHDELTVQVKIQDGVESLSY